MTNAELIKALRNCADVNGTCAICKYSPHMKCKWEMLEDAADALEAAEAYEEAWSKKCERLEKRIAELEENKEPVGTWDERYIEDANPLFRRRFYCTACEQWQTHGKTRFCPNCGAKMKGESNGET